MTDRELLQEALDALTYVGDKDIYSDTIDALRARLSQPEQEPVAWISHNAGLYHGKPDESLNPLPLYTAPLPREWVGLTREELEEISEFHFHGAFSGRDVYEDIETRLKEKNT